MQRYILVLMWWIQAVPAQAFPCAHRYYGSNHVVCVCNSTYCDSTPPFNVSDDGSYVQFTSSKAGLRFRKTRGIFGCETTLGNSTRLFVDTKDVCQSIQGFGGAFTDSTVLDIKLLSKDAQKNLLRSYFGPNGNRYNLVRVPIGGTDFSLRKYCYCDKCDEHTSEPNFSLTKEDYEDRIPLLHNVLELNPIVRLFAAAWTAPPWMKTNNDYVNGSLKEEYYQLYTEYLLTFLEKYRDQGLGIWAISTGNEPSIQFVNVDPINSMSWTPLAMAKWVSQNLGKRYAPQRTIRL